MRADLAQKCAIALAFLAVAGCSAVAPATPESSAPPSTDVTPSGSARPAVTVVDGAAKLDRAAATFALPLDAYGMSRREQQLSAAAAQIVFARCVTGSRSVGKATLEAARRSLAADTATSHWLFGYWNADYLAAHGLGGGAEAATIGDGLTVDPIKAKKCVSQSDYQAVEVIAPSYQSQSVEAQALANGSGEAWAATVADPRFRELAQKRDTCVTSQGYTVDGNSRLGGVLLDDGWTTEEKLKAALTEATCADKIELAGQAADLEAAYQQQLIDANQAEFVQIKKLADERVARATALLEEVGLI